MLNLLNGFSKKISNYKFKVNALDQKAKQLLITIKVYQDLEVSYKYEQIITKDDFFGQNKNKLLDKDHSESLLFLKLYIQKHLSQIEQSQTEEYVSFTDQLHMRKIYKSQKAQKMYQNSKIYQKSKNTKTYQNKKDYLLLKFNGKQQFCSFVCVLPKKISNQVIIGQLEHNQSFNKTKEKQIQNMFFPHLVVNK